jgi:hypothetical protein
MRFKGGLVNGTLVAIFGAVSFLNLFMAMNQHPTMKNISYVLGVVGILLGIYLLVTREVIGIPVLLTGVVYLGLGARAEHVALQIGSAGIGVTALIASMIMLATVKPPGE